MQRVTVLLCTALCACTVRGGPTPRVSAADTADTAAFADEIRAFEAADRAQPPAAPSGGVLFVGSSSIRMWPNVADEFPGVGALNRGFGGSTLPDVNRYARRVVLPYRPRVVVLYAGDNDIANGRTPEQVLADYRAFAALVHDSLPAARLVFLSIKPSPSRWDVVDRMREANALLRAEIARDPRATFVDVFTPMIGANGHPRPELFQEDSLHMTRAGYDLWRRLLAAHLPQ